MVEPGTILLGKYRIERILGKGGMGVVARAHHLQLEVPVAIKFLLPDVLEQQEVVKRFLREAQAAVKLKSEHVSRIIDVGTLETGAPYMVMEYLDGTDLADLLREHGRLSPGFAVDLMLQACEALAEAHALGIVHRDIKPANFFLTQGADGAPLLKVLDFGVSKAPRTLDEGLTHSHAIMGTPAYMSPEQMQSSKYVDPRTDIWALGLVLYELVSGRRPFWGENFAALVMMVATQPMRPLHDIALPAGLADVIAGCMAKDPARRFQSTAELAIALAPYAGTSIQAARSTERTARVLGLATVPMVRVASRAEEDEIATAPNSTLRESRGEHMTFPAAHAGPVPFHEVIAAAPGVSMDSTVHVARPSKRRGLVTAIVAATLLGAAGILVVVMQEQTADRAEPTHAAGDAPPAIPDGGTGLPGPAAIQAITAPDASVARDVAASLPADPYTATNDSSRGASETGNASVKQQHSNQTHAPVGTVSKPPARKRSQPAPPKRSTDSLPARPSVPANPTSPRNPEPSPSDIEKNRKTLNPFENEI